MSLSVDYGSKMTVTETLGTNTISAVATKRVVTHDALNITATMDANSTPPVSAYAVFTMTLVAGVYTIDLTSLLTTNGATISGSGKKVQVIRIRNLGANKMTFKAGASNGHNLFTADGQDIHPGADLLLRTINAGDTIDGTHKEIDVAGTAAQQAYVEILLG